MKIFVLTLGLLIAETQVQAQQTVNYEFLGLSFEIPAAWSGEEGDGYYAIYKEGEENYVVLMPHQARTRAELEAGAQEGLELGSSSMLQLNGEVSGFGEKGIQADMIGIVEWVPKEAHAVALLSSHGDGVVVLSLIGNGKLKEQHRELARTVARSVTFFEALVPPIVEEWQARFDGKKVTYMNTSGGISDTSSWTLCGNSFWYYGSTSGYSETEFYDGSTVSATSQAQDGSDGTWTIENDGEGGAVFVVRHSDGKVGRFSLERKDGKTYLNGSRYFVVAGDC